MDAADDAARDPREEAEWFGRLPEGVRDELRADWRSERERWAELLRGSRREIWRCVGRAAALFAAVELLFAGLDPGALALAGAVGAGVGAVWHLLDAERLLAAVTAQTAWFVLQLVWLYSGQGGKLTLLALLCGPILVGFAAAWLGMRRGERFTA